MVLQVYISNFRYYNGSYLSQTKVDPRDLQNELYLPQTPLASLTPLAPRDLQNELYLPKTK